MIDNFKIGYYYKYIGDIKDYFFYNEDKKKILKKWKKCIEIDKYSNFYVKFEGMKCRYYWGYRNFIESKHHPYVKKLLEEI
jgi:hypothetical protein